MKILWWVAMICSVAALPMNVYSGDWPMTLMNVAVVVFLMWVRTWPGNEDL